MSEIDVKDKVRIAELRKDIKYMKEMSKESNERIMEKLDSIHEETKRTNGRVLRLEEKSASYLTKREFGEHLIKEHKDAARTVELTVIEKIKAKVNLWQAILVFLAAIFGSWAASGFKTPWS